MQNNSDPTARAPSGLTRRQVIAGAAVAALAASTPIAMGAPVRRRRRARGKGTSTTAPLRRFMAAAATLGDGRVLITGGYDRPSSEKSPAPLSSAVIFDPATGSYQVAAPMSAPRARHASVALADGRVAVLGGFGLTATASVEIYDPRTNTWEAGVPLEQPRYDHIAASSGGAVYVMGGSFNGMLSSLETYEPRAKGLTGG